jgi:hypothetical protein
MVPPSVVPRATAAEPDAFCPTVSQIDVVEQLIAERYPVPEGSFWLVQIVPSSDVCRTPPADPDAFCPAASQIKVDGHATP